MDVIMYSRRHLSKTMLVKGALAIIMAYHDQI